MTKLLPSDPFRPETKDLDISYDALPSGAPYDWSPASREGGKNLSYYGIDFHLDLGCGTLKKGRLGLDRCPADPVDIVFDLERFEYPGSGVIDPLGSYVAGFAKTGYSVGGLPFPDNSIKSVVTHHVLEHIGDNFIPLMDELYRVLEPDGILLAITPLFPSHSAIADPDHRRYFCEGTWESFCGTPDNCWLSSFSVPYTKARFQMHEKDISPRSKDPLDWWGMNDAREIRVVLGANK